MSENYCVAWDAREEDLTFCTSSDGCTLRNGLSCCEGCESANQLIAVNTNVESEWICPEGHPPCPSCANGGPVYPGNAFAECTNNRCTVWLER